MKVKYGEMISANEPLSLLSKKEVSIKEAVGIARIIQKLNDEFVIYHEKHKELLDKYGKPTENGKYEFDSEEAIKLFNKDYVELLNIEVDLAVDPVKLTSDIQINAETILLIDKFIDFEEAEG